MPANLPEERVPAPTKFSAPHEPRLTPGEQWERYGRYPYLLSKLLFFLLLIAGGLWALDLVSAVAFPLFLSLLLAYLLDPTVDKLEERGISRSVSILIFLMVGIVLTVTFAIFLYPTLATQLGKILERLPRLWSTIQLEFLPWMETTFNIDVPPTMAETFERYGEGIREALPGVAQQVGAWASALVTQTGAAAISILNLVMIPIFTFYFLRDFDTGRLSLVRYLPPYRREFFISRFKLMDIVVGQWFRGQLQVSGILAVLYAISLGGVYGFAGLDIQSGVVIGLLTGFLNVIPYFGFAVGSLLAILVVLIDWGGWWPVFGVIACFTIIQLVESYYITPKVVGDKVGLKPVTVIIVLLIGGHVAGLLGVLLAIPVTGAIKVLIPDWVKWYEASSMYTGRPVLPAVLRVQYQGDQGEGEIVEMIAEPKAEGESSGLDTRPPPEGTGRKSEEGSSLQGEAREAVAKEPLESKPIPLNKAKGRKTEDVSEGKGSNDSGKG